MKPYVSVQKVNKLCNSRRSLPSKFLADQKDSPIVEADIFSPAKMRDYLGGKWLTH